MLPTLLTNPKVVEQQCFKAINVNNDISHCDSTVDAKLSWVRSQIIGGIAEIHTPFGIRKLTYADHTATGRCLRYIEDYIIHTVLPFYGNTHTSDSYVGDQTMKMLHEATEFVKKCLGGTHDDALLFCGSGTTAAIKRLQEVMGISIPSVLREKVLESCVTNEERWVVFVGPYEHHSNLLSWRQSLAEVIEIGLNNEGLINIDDLKSQLNLYRGTGRPMLGSFSACSNVTGICSDTRSLSRLLHEYGAFSCFDFAASGPYVEIDMRSGADDGYDAIALSPHKFLGGPGSPGILLMSKALYKLKDSPPSTCGGGTVNFVNCFNEKDTLYVNDIEEREDAGTPQIIQRVKVALAFQVKEYISCEVICKKERNYIEKALERLVKNPNIWVLGNTKVERQPILSFLVYATTYTSDIEEGTHNKPLNGAFVAKLMNDLFGIQARGGCACAGPYAHFLLGIDEQHSLAIKSAVEMGYNGAKLGWTRVSFPYYMSNEEYEFILDAIEFIASYGERFLSLYQFNWTTGSWTFKTKAFEEILLKEKDLKFCTLFGTNATKAFHVKRTKLKTHNCKTTEGAYIDTYSFYLDVANYIGKLLPKFPSHHTVPKVIDLDHVIYFV
ncbi:uncharacterized protein LOC111885846 [Lactuca sativa]|uniref:Aminotransferase class V domain-containing protein n=1 Tax=Lactuca sativa TaxID=4236 RepID=A0A9R1VG09_LACSA|nr:uncharacterized protein LOC111885846 [Lactuca sativa]KAJ0204041.1 hypothetical protein LSAT_V11C500240860 [Lactuca sativa]